MTDDEVRGNHVQHLDLVTFILEAARDLIRLRVSPEATLRPVHYEQESQQCKSSVEKTTDVAADVRGGWAVPS